MEQYIKMREDLETKFTFRDIFREIEFKNKYEKIIENNLTETFKQDIKERISRNMSMNFLIFGFVNSGLSTIATKIGNEIVKLQGKGYFHNLNSEEMREMIFKKSWNRNLEFSSKLLEETFKKLKKYDVMSVPDYLNPDLKSVDNVIKILRASCNSLIFTVHNPSKLLASKIFNYVLETAGINYKIKENRCVLYHYQPVETEITEDEREMLGYEVEPDEKFYVDKLLPLGIVII